MFSLFSGRLGKLLIPFLLCVLSTLVLQYYAQLDVIWQTLIKDSLPLVMLVSGVLFSLQFNRSRYTFLLIFLGVGAFSVDHLSKVISSHYLYSLFALLLLNTSLFSFFKDRGLMSVHGLMRLVLLASQAGGLWLLWQHYPQRMPLLWRPEFIPVPHSWDVWLALPDMLLLLGIALCVLHLVLTILNNSLVQSLFLVGIMGLTALLATADHPIFGALVLATACALVCMGILIESHDMAYRDELTRIPSRRALNQQLLSLGRTYTIAMMDIDHFKKFNDTHGHDVGDEVLKMVASKIARIGGRGKIFRYGGEEFTVVFPGKRPAQAIPYLETLRETIEQYQMVVREQKRPANAKPDKQAMAKRGSKKQPQKTLSVTISIGVAERTGELKQPEEVIKAADEALYRAKKKGRNCLSE